MSGLYIHIPFCQRRCHYCDFYSTTQESLQEAYVATVCREMHARRQELTEPVETLYIGGGTPSQLSPALLAKIIDNTVETFGIASLRECTVEANPDDITPAWVAGVRTAAPDGKVRVSMGIQTFDDATLALLGRRHTAAQAREAVQMLRNGGVDEISIDLMYGLPGEDDVRWADDLRQALALQVPHLSAYCLSYEEGTVLWQWRQQGKVQEAEDEQCARHYHQLRHTLLEAGYEHYELSNFALPGHRAQHNAAYWDGTLYLGLGPGAHSYDGATRSWNAPDLQAYLADPLHVRTTERLTVTDRYNEYLMTRLRTSKGISLDEVAQLFGDAQRDYCHQHVQTYIESHRLQYAADGRIVLSEEGLFVSDGIIADLFA